MSEVEISPKNLAAEESALGAMMWSRSVAAGISQALRPEDFWDEKHRVVFAALADLLARGESTDVHALAAELEKRRQLEFVGDKFYLIELLDTCPNEHAWRHYCDCILDSSARRQIRDLGTRFGSLRDEDEVRHALEQAGDDLTAVGRRLERKGPSHIAAGVAQSVERMMAAREAGTGITGLETGFRDLDLATGGLQPGNLLVVGGRTSMGKTSWALNIAHHVALHVQRPVLIFSLEMSMSDVSERLICQDARVSMSHYRLGDLCDLDMQRIQDAKARIETAPITIDDRGSVTSKDIRVIARQHRPALVIVDYLQLLHGGAGDNRAQQVSDDTRNLKVLAMQLGIPVIAASQLRRPPAGQKSKEPSLEDLKESGGIEQNADIVVLLYRPEVDKPRDPELAGYAEMNIAKNRNGRTGSHGLSWEGSITRFANLDDEEARL